MNTGEIIAKMAKEQGLSLRQLAIRAGIPYNTLYAIVSRNSARVNGDTLHRLARALGVMDFDLQSRPDEKPVPRKSDEGQGDEKSLLLQYLGLAATTGFLLSQLNDLSRSDLSYEDKKTVDFCREVLHRTGKSLQEPSSLDMVKSIGITEIVIPREVDEVLSKFGRSLPKSPDKWLQHIISIIVRYSRLNSAGRKELVKRLAELERLEEYKAPEIPQRVKKSNNAK